MTLPKLTDYRPLRKVITPKREAESDITSPKEETDSGAVRLKREVGLVGGCAIIVGTMIGSGIFITPVGVLRSSGSVGMSLVVWFLAGLLSMLGALCYAELGTLVPKSGGEYAYLMEAFGHLNKFWGPVPAYLFAWTTLMVLKTSAMAVISMTFAEYTFTSFFTGCKSPSDIKKMIAISALCLIAFINCFSVKLSTKLQTFFTFSKILALLLIIVGGFIRMYQGHLSYLSTGFAGTNWNPSQIALAFYSGLWAYDGWNNLNFLAEEISEPNKNIPRSIMIGIPTVTILYVLTNIAYLTALSPSAMLQSNAVAVDWSLTMFGFKYFWIIPICVAFSTFGAINGELLAASRFIANVMIFKDFADVVLGATLSWLIPLSVTMSCIGAINGLFFATSRVCYVAARERHLMHLLSYVHITRLTPAPAILFTAVVSILMVIPGSIDSLIDFFSFAVWIFYGLTMVALLTLRYTQPKAVRPYKVFIVIPIIVLAVAIYLVLAPILRDPAIEYLYATGFILCGLLLYIPFVYYKVHFACLNKITMFFQLIMEVSPEDNGKSGQPISPTLAPVTAVYQSEKL